MGYKARPNQRKHKHLIGDALAEAELAEQELDALQRAAGNDATRAHVRGIQIRVLLIANTLNKMMEIARLETDHEDE
jgi:hypothetical protein